MQEAAGERTAEEMRKTRSGPLVRKIASQHNIDIAQLEGTGTSGRVTKNDILSYIESGPSAEETVAAVPAAPVAACPHRCAAAAACPLLWCSQQLTATALKPCRSSGARPRNT
ncbi:MAG: E3 binding domain-containing protein [Pyrinomonadaceae bacterium]